MIKTLLAIRFRALLAGLTSQAAKRSGKKSTGILVLLAVAFAYIGVVGVGMMCMLFGTLAGPYHAMGLDWLYFSVAGLMALGLSVFGSVFTTQNQLYDAKDNALLLSMPIKPGAILLSRMLPLLGLNLLLSAMVLGPAAAMYAIFADFSVVGILLQLVSLVCICLLAQAIACALGFLLHRLLKRLNRSVASVVFLVLFLGVYFGLYSQASNILYTLSQSSWQIAQILQQWVWPLYAMGKGCLGNFLHAAAFIAISCAIFALVYWLLSATFLRTATASDRSHKKRSLQLGQHKASSPVRAIMDKELRKFLGSPVYLTNMGLGLILTLALPVLTAFLRQDLVATLSMLPLAGDPLPILICCILSFTASTCCISTPSVSLEGKNLWILRSMPVSSKDILLGKLGFHLWMTVPVTVLAATVLAILLDCTAVQIVLCALIAGLTAVFSGVFGMWAGILWAKLDYINEAYPCKQSISVAVAIFGIMGLGMALGFGYLFFLSAHIPSSTYMAIWALLLAAGSWAMYQVITSWGVRKWESLQA